MAAPLVPARLEFHQGTPYSGFFGDVYHSAEGALAQARHVFLGGNGLPGRWAGRDRFVILETGFGLGINFLATWRAWRADPSRPRRLHYVALERHPFSLDDLRVVHGRYPELQHEAAALHAQWPPLVPGGHRAELESGAVVLTLFFADASIARDLRLAADAIYLDGFAPAKNPDMWTPQLLRAISRLAAPGCTAATWSVAGNVRAALEEAGFAVEKRPGFGAKREMLCATYEGRGREEQGSKAKTATVIGAGLAGAAVCERLCSRGWEVTLIERHCAPAQEASGNRAGTFHPIVTPDDSLFARMTRAGFLSTLGRLSALDGVRWDPCGVLQLARDDKESASQRASIAALALPADYAQLVTREEASAHAGVPVAAGGLWFPRAGWIQPPSLVDALLASCGDRLTTKYGVEAKDLKSESQPLILATANDALLKVPHARLRRVRGQITLLPEAGLEPPHVVVLRGGMVLPALDGRCVIGASYDVGDEDPAPRAESDEGNLRRLQNILSVEARYEDLKSRVGFRVVAPDRLPVVGRLADNVYASLAFGSRGLTWTPLAAELLACLLEGDPLPLEGKLVDAVSPARFALRAERRARAR